MNRLEVKANKRTLISGILLGLIFVPMGLASLLIGLLNGFQSMPLVAGVLSLMMFGVVVWIVRRAQKRSVKYLSEEGLVRNDGRSFSWSDLSRVVDKVVIRPPRRKVIWRTEIQFKNGESAWVIPSKVGNYGEVGRLLSSLPCEHKEVNA